jgi:hypothetical protein
MLETPSPLLNDAEGAEYSRVSKSCYRRRIRPHLPLVKLSPRRCAVRKVDLDAFLSGVTVPPVGGDIPSWM